MDYKKKKRKAQTIQETVKGDIQLNKRMKTDREKQTFNIGLQTYRQNDDIRKVDEIDKFYPFIYAGILVLCLIVACVTYGIDGGKKTSSSYSYPSYVYTIDGVLTDIYNGKYDNTSSPELYGNETDLFDENIGSNSTYDNKGGSNYGDVSSPIGIAGGAIMPLDDGTFALSYPEASSHDELISQIESALASNDIKFVGSKIGYVDDAGNINGYPESVVETFTSYMAGNADKRNSFLASIKNEEKFSSENVDAFIIALPIISFKVTTDYDDTTFTFSGFGEQVINKGQQANVSPLLPCMYQITARCPEWDEPIEGPLEATFGENLEVNFGKN